MDEDYISVAVADMRLEFKAVNCRFKDRSFGGFALLPNSRWMASGADHVVVSVQIAPSVSPPEDFVNSFVAEPEDDDINQCSWTLHSLADSSEVITALFRNPNSEVRAAQVTYKLNTATLLIVPSKPAEDKVNPHVFPLFNIFLSRLLLRRGGFLLHSSTVCIGVGKGLVFTAPSGTGKSTIAGLFRKSGAIVINDDMVAIRQNNGVPTAYSIPMPYYKQKPSSTILKAMFRISQSPDNILAPIDRAAVRVSTILANVVQQPLDRQSAEFLVHNVSEVVTKLDCYTLGFRPDKDVVSLVKSLYKRKSRRDAEK